MHNPPQITGICLSQKRHLLGFMMVFIHPGG